MNKELTHEVAAVVFDMAGTTVNEGKIVYQCVQRALAAHGFEYELNEVIYRIGGFNKKEGIQILMEEQGEAVTTERLNLIFTSFLEMVEAAYRSGEGIAEKEGATDLFEFLRANDIKVVLDTGYHRSTADILIDRMDWKEKGLIDFSVTSDEVEQGRPQPYMIRKAMEHFDLADAGMVMKVGDTRSDIEEGKNAGCQKIVGISSELYDKQALLDMGATHAIDQLSELKAIIAQ